VKKNWTMIRKVLVVHVEPWYHVDVSCQT
jgi:hypothetical protein